MIFVWILLAMMFGALMGYLLKGVFTANAFNGVIKVEETENGLAYQLLLQDDPELLQYQDYVTFKVISPDYENLIRKGN